jgi:YD repeat-containing protein
MQQQQQQQQIPPNVDITAKMNANIAKMKDLMQNRVAPIKKVGGAIITDYDDEDGVVKYTRDDLDRLMEQRRPGLKLSTNDTSDDGYFNNLLFKFQIYIAFINALTNTANMSASMIFGNLTLQDAFSEFLVNVLNMVLKTDVANLTPDQLRDLLQQNRPVLQQISGIIIDEASRLLVGLSDVCSQIAMDWIQNVLPGLVKSAAIGVPSAVEAAIPPLGEVVEIIDTVVALLGSFMKVVGGVQRNTDNISQGVGLVENAYKSLQDIQKLLTDPSAATSAVLNPNLNVAAQNLIKDRVASATSAASARIMPRAAATYRPLRRQVGGKKTKSRRYLKDPKKFKTYISKIRNKTAKKEMELINSIRELKNI